MMTANGKNASSTQRKRANTSASSVPPTVAATSASTVIVSVTSSERNSTGQSPISVFRTRLGAGRMTGSIWLIRTTASQATSAPTSASAGST